MSENHDLTDEKRTEKAFESVSDTTKQLVTLSTGILALTITFSKDIFQRTPGLAIVLLALSWGLYLASIIVGMLTLQAVAGAFSKPMGRLSPEAIYWSPINTTSLLQNITFLAATALIIVFGVMTTVAAISGGPAPGGGTPTALSTVTVPSNP